MIALRDDSDGTTNLLIGAVVYFITIGVGFILLETAMTAVLHLPGSPDLLHGCDARRSDSLRRRRPRVLAQEQNLPWMWALNGAAGTPGTFVAIVISMHWNIGIRILASADCDLLAGIPMSGRRAPQAA